MADEHRRSRAAGGGGPLADGVARVYEWIEARQRAGYRDAAEKLGLGGDPVGAWERLTADHGADAPGSDALRHRPGWDQMTDDELARFDAGLAADKLRDSLPLPTRFEHRPHYRALNSTADGLLDVLEDGQRRIAPRPVIATMPTGQVNARSSREPRTRTPVIFFEQGLSEFLTDFARIVAWALPPLGPRQLFDDHALMRLGRSYTMPPQVSTWLSGALYGYVMSGTPVLAEEERVPVPPHNQFTCVTLHMLMLQFIVGHEVGHVALGHLDAETADDPWRDEFHADEFGASLSARRLSSWSGGVASALWAVDLALSCLHLLHKAMALTMFDGRVRWVNPTHPDEISRRQQQRGLVGQMSGRQLSCVTVDAYRELLGMSDALIERLATLALTPLVLARAEGKTPSPLWREHIALSFAPSGDDETVR